MRTGEGDERVTTSWLDLLPEDDDDGDGTDHRFLLRPLLLVFTSTVPEHGAATSGPPHDTGRSSARASGTPRDTGRFSARAQGGQGDEAKNRARRSPVGGGAPWEEVGGSMAADEGGRRKE